MNPTDDQTNSTPPANQPTLPPVPPLHEDSQASAANVIRSQIDQIFGLDGAPNPTLSHTSHGGPMINQPASTNLVPEKTEDTPSPRPENAHEQYHSAWQEYYQKYYEKYYISAMQQQNQAYNQQLAAVHLNARAAAEHAAKAVQDGTLTQKEAMEEMRQDILSRVKKSANKVRKSRHFIPAICAIVVILAAIFIQYNGLIFAQVSSFVSPGSTSGQNIIVGTGNDQPVSPEPRVIIPKINVNAPVVYGLTDLSEQSSQKALEGGVIHYPIAGASAFPGQNGNAVFLGHSSSDFFKPGDYKFIFVQLNRLSAGDLFYLDYQSKRYTYRVRETRIINPNEVSTLAIGDNKPYATLVTCDPPGTARQRLVVIGEQISPDPSLATSTQNDSAVTTVQGDIVGKPPTLFEQIFGGR
ncbi:class E sortase [Candidatus Saccharibacteria bacterium]|nr:class E sortase [Candidatus Saccharibacteria bacterium]